MALDRRHMSLEALTAYGSDSDAEGDDGGPRAPAQPRAQAFGLELLPAPRTAGGEPDAKKARAFADQAVADAEAAANSVAIDDQDDLENMVKTGHLSLDTIFSEQNRYDFD